MADKDPFEFVKAELESDDPARIITVLQRLNHISVALGPQKFKTNLVPLLITLVDNTKKGDVGDEVASQLAKALGEMGDFISSADATTVFAMLGDLCQQDEAEVRDKAVDSLNKLYEKHNEDDHKLEIVTIFKRLIGDTDSWAPRVSACGLVHTAYAAAAASEKSDIIDAFGKLCTEPESQQAPMVQSAAAKRLGAMLDAIAKAGSKPVDVRFRSPAHVDGSPGAERELSSLYIELLVNDHDYVKAAAVSSSPAIFKYWRVDEGFIDGKEPSNATAGGAFRKSAGDKQWKVRVAAAEVLAEVAKASEQSGNSSKAVMTICKTLLDDAEDEVKYAMAKECAKVAKVMNNRDFVKDDLFPSIQNFVVKEPECPIRTKLVGVMMELAEPLGKDLAGKLIMQSGLFRSLCDQTRDGFDMAVQIAVLNCVKTGRFLDVVGVLGGHEDELFDTLRPLAAADKWRTKHAVMQLLPKLVTVLKQEDPSGFVEKLYAKFGFKLFFCDENTEEGEAKFKATYNLKDANVQPWALDEMAQIRKDYTETCKQIADVLSGDGAKRGGKGGKFATDYILPVLRKCATDKELKDRYHKRIVLLSGLCALGEYIDEQKVDESLKIVLDMAAEKLDNGKYVPSLRAMIARDLPDAAKNSSIKADIRKTLETMIVDEDPDVKNYAKSSLPKV